MYVRWFRLGGEGGQGTCMDAHSGLPHCESRAALSACWRARSVALRRDTTRWCAATAREAHNSQEALGAQMEGMVAPSFSPAIAPPRSGRPSGSSSTVVARIRQCVADSLPTSSSPSTNSCLAPARSRATASGDDAAAGGSPANRSAGSQALPGGGLDGVGQGKASLSDGQLPAACALHACKRDSGGRFLRTL